MERGLNAESYVGFSIWGFDPLEPTECQYARVLRKAGIKYRRVFRKAETMQKEYIYPEVRVHDLLPAST